MARPASRFPTELELEILKVVWKQESCSVRTVREALESFRPLAYNSVLTMMTIMVRKGYLKRKPDKSGLFHTYSPKVAKEATRKGMLMDIVTRAYAEEADQAIKDLKASK